MMRQASPPEWLPWVVWKVAAPVKASGYLGGTVPGGGGGGGGGAGRPSGVPAGTPWMAVESIWKMPLEPSGSGTKITLRHSNVPEGHNGYKTGWQSCYFDPMKAYFLAAANKK